MDCNNLKNKDIAHLWHPYSDIDSFDKAGFPIIDSAKGCYFYDIGGKEYLDAIASWWCVNLGHSHPKLIGAIKKQSEKLQNVILGGLSHENSILLAKKIADITPPNLKHSFFAGDGASAIEASLRIALQYRTNRGEESRKRFVALEEGYHGDTLGAVGVGFVERFHKELKGAVVESYRATSPHCASCPFGKNHETCDIECFSSMENIIKNHHKEITAAVIEPLCQGSAGIRIYPKEYLVRLREACDRYGILLIADEIAVGFGRTGGMFATGLAGVNPDIMTLGKGMTGGYLPMSAAVVSEEIYDSFRGGKTFYYGHTFSGNPITSALALEAINLYEEEDILSKVALLEEYLKVRTQKLAARLGGSFWNVLGGIAMIDISKKEGGEVRATQICAKAREEGVFMRPLGSVIYVWPPLVISQEECDKIFTVLENIVEKIKRS